MLAIKRVVGVLSALFVAAVPAVTPPAHADVDVDEVVTDSMIFVSITFTGRVLIPGEHLVSGKNTWSSPVDVNYSCSAFVVDPAGFIATAGHCVEISTDVRNRIRSGALSSAAEAGELDSADPASLAETAADEQWPVQGLEPESQVARKLEVMQPLREHRVVDRWSSAQLVDFQRFDDGDNALLRLVGYPPLKPLVITEQPAQVGDAVTAVGFPGVIGDDGAVDTARVPQPSFKTGTVSSRQVQPSGAPTLEINAQVAPGMSGGPTVNGLGHVVGINSFGVGHDQTIGFEFITDSQSLRSLLLRNGVTLAVPEPAPPEPKSFPWPWVIVGIVVVAAAALVAVVLLRPKWFGLRETPEDRASSAAPQTRGPKALEAAPASAVESPAAPLADTEERPPKR